MAEGAGAQCSPNTHLVQCKVQATSRLQSKYLELHFLRHVDLGHP